MSDNQEINSFLQKPGSLSRQSFIFKGIATSSKCASKLDLNGLLELLSVTNDINLQLKVFSALSAYLMFNKGANIDVLIKCNTVYNKIIDVLSRGLPRKCTEALNFLSTLLYTDTEEDSTTKKRTLALYARNMTRVSGCLSKMCEMLANGMMYHDTWKSLCQCLAEACSGCEINQSYCSHLIPVCIQKCSQVNIDILLVLQSLMLNHSRNIQLFLDCNGVSIFTRELLHCDKCLQLLTIVVQCSKTSTSLLQQTNVLADLRDFLRLYGPNSQLGQKAIIILNHISSSAKGMATRQNSLVSENKMHANKLPIKIDVAKKSLLENDCNANTENDFEETKVLIQNVMKEIYNWKQIELQNAKKDVSKLVLDAVNRSRKPSIASKQKFIYKKQQLRNEKNTPTDNINNLMEDTRKKRLHCDINRSELSFTFLEKYVSKHNGTTIEPLTFNSNENEQVNNDVTQRNDTTHETISNAMKDDKTIITLQNFRPNFASTPFNTTESNPETTFNTYKTEQTKQNKYQKKEIKKKNMKSEHQKNKGMKNASLGARFFGAINNSCTTFVKTVKNIFNKKEPSYDLRSSSSNPAESTIVKYKRSGTYSFINYMRKRDSVMNNNWMRNKITDRSEFSTKASSCKTCDNTELLKQKLKNDEFLKQTIKKLKVGINLYGCDFKKISKTIWPRDSYMTPLVLRNLYRKLLRK